MRGAFFIFAHINKLAIKVNLINIVIFIKRTMVRPHKKTRDYLGIIPNMRGGGSYKFPQPKTKKKGP